MKQTNGSLKGKVAVITGAARGIGRAAATAQEMRSKVVQNPVLI